MVGDVDLVELFRVGKTELVDDVDLVEVGNVDLVVIGDVDLDELFRVGKTELVGVVVFKLFMPRVEFVDLVDNGGLPKRPFLLVDVLRIESVAFLTESVVGLTELVIGLIEFLADISLAEV